MTRALAAVPLLAALLTGCGKSSDANAGGPPAKAAGLEEETSAAPAKSAAAAAAPARPKIDSSLVPEPGTPLVRETYSYIGGVRDPFASVLEGTSIGPELADLDLVAIAYQERAPSASVAVLRDRITGKRYSVREGERAGRARVANIGPKQVIFTIDDYGTTRQVTLSLRKREDNLP
ncbi:MAG TPA: hypothetical protein VGP61_11620 [Gemmatimonadales bacterium]|jgi:hypothetical protein|nr:hypothetical protein [Gemmatimonadales bacterium]